MDTDLEQLRSLGSEVGPGDDQVRSRIRDLLLAEANLVAPASVRRSRWASRRGLAVLAAILVVPAAVAVASGLRGDVADNLGEFLTGSDSTHEIGRAVKPSDDPPGWMNEDNMVDRLVIASNGSHHLFAGRDNEGHVSFSLDDSITRESAGGANPFVNQFQGQSVIPLYAAPGDNDSQITIAGLVAADVVTVELRYDSGPPDEYTVKGSGFIFNADLGRVENEGGVLIVDRRPLEIQAFDADGGLLQTVPAMCVAGMTALALRSDPGDYYFAGCDG